MKYFMQLTIIGTLAFTAQVQSMYLHLPEDDSVVNAIKQQSNLTSDDAKSYKLLWLGKRISHADTAVAAGAVGYAGLSGIDLLSAAHDKASSIFVGENFAKWAKESNTLSFLSNKGVWQGAGAIGAGYLAYNFLYSRVKAGIQRNVTAFYEMCKNLVVAKYQFQNLQQLQQVAAQEGNTAWSIGSPIAIDKGIDNLLMQRGVALFLLDQIGAVNAQDPMRSFINNVQGVLQQNKQMLQPFIATEYNQRNQNRDRYMADLKAQQAQANVTGQYIKNVADTWKVLKDIGHTGYKIGKFAYENKEVVGTTIVGGALYKLWNQ